MVSQNEINWIKLRKIIYYIKQNKTYGINEQYVKRNKKEDCSDLLGNFHQVLFRTPKGR
jgi:hypothetical protein